jgi:SAM-dependent methyltransferase
LLFRVVASCYLSAIIFIFADETKVIDMDKAYWNTIGSGYNEEIFDVYAEDRQGKLKRYFRKYSDPNHFAIDFGCGTGKALPYLAPVFKKVLGLDISEALLKQARQMPYENTEFRRMDLAKPINFSVLILLSVVMWPFYRTWRKIKTSSKIFKGL